MLNTVPNEAVIHKASKLLVAMANPRRLAILELLIQEEMSVGAIAKAVGLSQSALSQHLSRLRRARLVSSRREAQTIYYFSQSAAVASMLEVLTDICRQPSPTQLKRGG